MTPIGTFRVGEDVSVALDAVSGDVGIVTSITATMRRVSARSGLISGPPISVVIANRAAAGLFPVGWNITVTAAVTSVLLPGLYAIDARLIGTGFVEITDTSAFIQLTEAAVT